MPGTGDAGGQRPPLPFQLSVDRPLLPLLNGKRLIVHVVVNVEQWPFDAPMPRTVLPAPHGLQAVPDVANFGWVEYGMRCGLPRIMRLLADREIPASVSINAGVIDAYPRAAEAIRDAGWEFIGHGIRQRSLQAEEDEEAVIRDSLDRIETFTGARPRGWLGPGLQETFETPHILAAQGIDYVCDWCADDLPTWIETRNGSLVALPYTLELNDSVLHAVEHQPSSSMHDRLVDTLATFDRELEDGPCSLTLALHPHLMGVPHRAVHLGRALDRLVSRDDCVFVTGSRFSDWFAQSVASS
jgi:allantoinase